MGTFLDDRRWLGPHCFGHFFGAMISFGRLGSAQSEQEKGRVESVIGEGIKWPKISFLGPKLPWHGFDLQGSEPIGPGHQGANVHFETFGEQLGEQAGISHNLKGIYITCFLAFPPLDLRISGFPKISPDPKPPLPLLQFPTFLRHSAKCGSSSALSTLCSLQFWSSTGNSPLSSNSSLRAQTRRAKSPPSPRWMGCRAPGSKLVFSLGKFGSSSGSKTPPGNTIELGMKRAPGPRRSMSTWWRWLLTERAQGEQVQVLLGEADPLTQDQAGSPLPHLLGHLLRKCLRIRVKWSESDQKMEIEGYKFRSFRKK